MKFLITIIISLLFTSCGVTNQPMQSYVTRGGIVQCMSDKDLNESFHALYKNETFDVRGYYIAPLNMIRVRWSVDKDKNGKNEPDFYALGHEYWHSINGEFHK